MIITENSEYQKHTKKKIKITCRSNYEEKPVFPSSRFSTLMHILKMQFTYTFVFVISLSFHIDQDHSHKSLNIFEISILVTSSKIAIIELYNCLFSHFTCVVHLNCS